MFNTARISHQTLIPRLATLVALALGVSACGTMGKISRIGEAPPLSAIQNPVAHKDYEPITLPMPRPQPIEHQSNSLWRSGAKNFFDDQRASRIGDILTVQIDITDKAAISNSTTRARSAREDAGITKLFGMEASAANVLPEAVSPSALATFGSDSTSTGSGSVDRSEIVSLTIAAIITQTLPNGNLVIQGRQEVRVNFEVRELLITGVVRPEDISHDNIIQHSQIAEARVSYGGRGHITDLQTPRYGHQLYNIIFPF
jgi:flagellar L-ring protein precursor FlgH